MNNKFNCKFTLYVFYDYNNSGLKYLNKHYKKEFEENSDWLKFGFHALNNYKDYSKNDEIESDFKLVNEKIRENIGEKSLTNYLRLEKFNLSLNNAVVLKNNGVIGLLGSDNSNKTSYYLSKNDESYLKSKDYYKDDYFEFYNTDIRIENNDFIFFNNNDLQDEYLVIFTHEWNLNKVNKLLLLYLVTILSQNNVMYICL